jgi:GDSL-like Lipase/Acylhydrolase family
MTEPVQHAGPHRAGIGRIPLLVRALFVVAFAFTTLGLLESAFVVADLFTGGSLSARRAPDLELGVRSWTVHHAMRPGYDNPTSPTNSFGLRSPEVAVPKPAGTYRILLLGDSFTFGFRADNAVVFAVKLEQRLRTEGFPSVEVVNAGVLSYCPLLEYLQYRHQLHVLEPDLVVLNFDMSDVQDHLEYSRSLVSSSDGVPLYVTEPSLRQAPSPVPGLLSFQWVARYATAARRRTESAVEGVPFTRDQDRYLWALDNGPEMDREVQSTLAPIVNLADLLEHNRIPLVLATYPQPWQVSADATPLPPIRDQYGIGQNKVHQNDRPFRKLEAFADKHGLAFVNATAAFRQHPAPASLFLSSDFHFTGRGHALYAEVLANYVVRHASLRSPSTSMPVQKEVSSDKPAAQ